MKYRFIQNLTMKSSAKSVPSPLRQGLVSALLLFFSLNTRADAPAADASTAKKSYGAPVSVWTDIEAKAAAQPPASDSMEKKLLVQRLAAKGWYEQYRGWTAPQPSPLPEGKLRNLADAPGQPRFPLAGKDWPQKPGDASVCLWEDDKVAAMSFFVWGAVGSSIQAAEELSKTHPEARFSGSIIVGFAERPALHPGNKDPNAPADPKAWDIWKDAFTSIGLHFLSLSMTWDVDPVLEDGWPGPEWECAESIHEIDSHIPGHKTKVFMQPGGYIGAFNVAKTWEPVISRYYVAQVAGKGGGINPANQIDYFHIQVVNGQKLGQGIADPTADAVLTPDNLNNLLNSDPNNPNYKFYRGWIVPSTHILSAKTDSDPLSMLMGKELEFLDKHKDDIWSGCIDDVALYGQERDTATLKTTEATDTQITVQLTSKMDPANFDYPLTVKVRLPDSWKTISATQDGKPIPSRMIKFEGNAYGLIKVVPDQGLAVLQSK